MVLAAVEAKLASIANARGDSSLAASDAFLTAADKAVNGVLIRPDGNEVGYAWLQHLIKLNKLENSRGLTGQRSLPEHHAQLLYKLATVLSPRGDAREWVTAEQETWRRDRAVAAIAVAGLSGAGGPEKAAALIGDVLRLGLWATAQEYSFSESSSSERWLLAIVIARCDAPRAWFEELWRSLAPLRDRAGHATTSAGGHAGDATVIAVTWFLFGLDAVDVGTPAHRELWRSLHSAIQECTRTQPLARDAWLGRYKLLAAHLAHRLINVGDEEARLDLRALLWPMLCLDMTLPQIVAVLFHAGVMKAVVAACSERGDLLVQLLRRLEAEQACIEAKQKEQLGRQFRFSQEISLMANAAEAFRQNVPGSVESVDDR